MSEPAPLVTVVTVVYNGESNLEPTIRSVIAQKDARVEYIIVDGGSSDGTIDIIKRYERDVTKWISEPDKGLYDAMNKGTSMARGEWINFMNAGDSFLDADVLKDFAAFNKEDSDVVYGDALVQYPTFKTLYKRDSIDNIWKRMPVCHQAVFARTRLMKQFPFNLTYRFCSDHDFLYTLYLLGKKFRYFPRTVCNFDFTGGVSIRNLSELIKEQRKIVLGKKFSIYKWGHYAFKLNYIRAAVFAKRVLGPKITSYITELLRAR